MHKSTQKGFWCSPLSSMLFLCWVLFFVFLTAVVLSMYFILMMLSCQIEKKKHPTIFRSQVHFSLCHHKTCNVPCFNGLHFVRHEGSMKSVFCNTNVICNDANTEFFIYFILNIASIYKVYILINILSLNFDPAGSWRELCTCAPCGSIPAKVTQDSIATSVAPPRRRE